jgi:hypothetical protein
VSKKQVALEYCALQHPMSLKVTYSRENLFGETIITKSSTINQHPFPQRDLCLQQSNCFTPTPQKLRTPGLEDECFVTEL